MMACTMSQYTSTVRHRYRIPRAGMALATLLSASACWAQAPYPVKPVRVIVPFPPGAGVDIVTRIVTPKFSEALGQSFVVDNRAGAGGIIGTEIAARAPADGYTIVLGHVGTHAINPALYAKVPYDAVKDFTPITLLATIPLALIVHPSVSANNVKELVALAQKRPGELNFASAGNGGPAHLAGVDAGREGLDGIDGRADGGADGRVGRQLGRAQPVVADHPLLVGVRHRALFQGRHVGESPGHGRSQPRRGGRGKLRPAEVQGEAQGRESQEVATVSFERGGHRLGYAPARPGRQSRSPFNGPAKARGPPFCWRGRSPPVRRRRGPRPRTACRYRPPRPRPAG